MTRVTGSPLSQSYLINGKMGKYLLGNGYSVVADIKIADIQETP